MTVHLALFSLRRFYRYVTTICLFSEAKLRQVNWFEQIGLIVGAILTMREIFEQWTRYFFKIIITDFRKPNIDKSIASLTAKRKTDGRILSWNCSPENMKKSKKKACTELPRNAMNLSGKVVAILPDLNSELTCYFESTIEL